MIYFLSDTHFGNKKYLGYCQRPFSSNKEADESIIQSINDTVKTNDTLYFLGDFCHQGDNPKIYRQKIQCKNIHLILGNHDIEKKFINGFKSISLLKEIVYRKQKIVMCHYPMRAWNKSYRNSWMLYGHVHNRLNHEDEKSFKLTLDVGVDNIYNRNVPFGTPWSFEEINQLFTQKKKKYKEKKNEYQS